MDNQYTKLNLIIGWVVFAIASLVYCLTIEPTTSFWDCGEYIATAYKLEVGHPPGAPLFLLIANLFSNLALGEVEAVAKWVNIMSAFCSSFTILFLFWTITAFGRKLAQRAGEVSQSAMYAIFGAGIVGALAYTFSDSFWFSAVEGEVYAMSSMFTAITFWAILKWEREADKPGADRWIVLIFFLVGLSVGVHMLSMLTLPAVAMIYYLKKYPFTKKGFIIANITGIILLGLVFKFIVPGVVSLAGKFELFFVNSVGMPFDTGTVIFFLLLISGIVFGIRYTRKKQKPLLNTALLSLTFFIIGFSTFGVLIIRSNANPTIDENNPEDAVGLLAYLNREQYGDWPLVNGQNFNTPLDRREPYSDGNPVYVRDEEKGRYVISDDRKSSVRNFDSQGRTLLSRMWSQEEKHVREYVQHIGKDLSDFYNPVYDAQGNVVRNRQGQVKWDFRNPKAYPTLADNIKYMVNYQIGWMYFRYFMWNFSGRQNDIQGHGNPVNGNWISGIKFIDSMRLGPQSNLPDHLSDNPARNKYYLLPFILGVVGLLFHYKKDAKSFYVVMLLFLMTGLAIVFYLNQYPLQPRERDYAYVGSFYAFAIWIGLGVFAIYDWLRTKAPAKVAAIGTTAVCTLLVPGIMAKENWDDHDRSDRYTAREIAKNYLDSCEKGAILFTNGDNDTFPLWYVQEVEGYRTDVRIVNLSLLNTDWYIDQMKRAAYDSPPVPFSLERDQYKQGTRDIILFKEMGVSNRRWAASDLMRFIASDDPKTKSQMSFGDPLNVYPTKKVRIPVDKEKVLANGTVALEDSARILPYLDWNINKNQLVKKEIMILDLIANNNWERPIYFSITVGNSRSAYMYLTDYFAQEGMAYKLVPYKVNPQSSGFGEVNTDVMYDHLMNEFSWGNLEKEGIYMDETNRRMIFSIRNNYARLAEALIAEGKNDMAEAVLDRGFEVTPPEKFELSYFSMSLVEGYFRIGATEKARKFARSLAETQAQEMIYFGQFKGPRAETVRQQLQQASSIYSAMIRMAGQYGDEELREEFNKRYNEIASGF